MACLYSRVIAANEATAWVLCWPVLFRGAIPMLKRGLAIFGKQALRTGLEVANDVADGRDWRDSARQHVPTGISKGIKTFASAWPDISRQSGNGNAHQHAAPFLFGKRKRAWSKGSENKKKKSV